ncbi:MAG: PilZ domain-containing protein [Planctomycetes bacterium]|nr:PilZ domain-containing protein [Planctomycetota bacterium]
MNREEEQGGIVTKPPAKKEETSITMDSVTFFYLLAHYWLPRETIPHSTAVKSYTPNNLVFISLEKLKVGQQISLCLTTPNVHSEGLYPQVMAKVAKVEKVNEIFEIEAVFDHELPVEAPVEGSRPQRLRTQIDFEEQRAWQRHEVSIDAEFQVDRNSEPIPCKLLDISNGGVRLCTAARLKKDQKICLSTSDMGTGQLKKMLCADVMIHWVRQKRHNYFEAGGQFLTVNFKEWQA